MKVLTAGIPWDVEQLDLSHDGKRIAFVTNEYGIATYISLSTSRRLATSPSSPCAFTDRTKAGGLELGC
jgi:hypothetical protein